MANSLQLPNYKNIRAHCDPAYMWFHLIKSEKVSSYQDFFYVFYSKFVIAGTEFETFFHSNKL